MKLMVDVDLSGTNIPSYLSAPDGASRGSIILVHEVWGLNDHTKDVADRLSNAGYTVLAPDLLWGTGISDMVTPELQESLFDPERRNEVQPKLREIMAPLQAPDFGATTTKRLKDCFNYLYDLPASDKRVAIMGFCFGGTYSFNLAMEEPRLKAAIPFYGHCDSSVEELAKIKCPVMAFYGEKDENLMGSLDDLKKRMAEAKVSFTTQVYSNCGHAFFNDTNSFAYNKEAADDAWQKCMDFLVINLD